MWPAQNDEVKSSYHSWRARWSIGWSFPCVNKLWWRSIKWIYDRLCNRLVNTLLVKLCINYAAKRIFMSSTTLLWSLMLISYAVYTCLNPCCPFLVWPIKLFKTAEKHSVQTKTQQRFIKRVKGKRFWHDTAMRASCLRHISCCGSRRHPKLGRVRNKMRSPPSSPTGRPRSESYDPRFEI